MDRDGEIEKRKTVVGNFMGEFDGWMESGHKLYEADEIFSGAGGNAEAVIYETTKEEGHGSSVLLRDLFFQHAHKKAGITGSHAGAHGNTAGL